MTAHSNETSPLPAAVSARAASRRSSGRQRRAPSDVMEHPVSILLFRALLRALPEHEIVLRQVFASVGIGPEELAQEDGTVTVRTCFALVETFLAFTGDPLLGLHVPLPVGAGELLELGPRSCATMREGLERVLRYFTFVAPAVRLELVESGPSLIVRHTLDPSLRDRTQAPAALVDLVLAAMVDRCRRYVGEDFQVLAIRLMRPEPAPEERDAWVGEYRRVIGAETAVSFGHPSDEFEVSAALADKPLASAEPVLLALVDRHVEERLAATPAPTLPIQERTRSVLHGLLPTGNPSLTNVARSLGTGERTLQRLLKDAGTSHKELLEEVRREVALKHVEQSDMLVQQIAYLAGFTDVPSFYRAFRRWTGQTPAAYRSARAHARTP